ncbi:hypothetical protein ACG98H_05865 [Corynebacterium sp. L4756]|uniref:hypothetical protein n=1 Tax=unclassified Corynebacterium TaxID=2624378 RepID=UPI00374D9E22
MMKRAMASAIALIASLTLVACGSATVDSDSEVSPDATVAPLERGDSESSEQESESSSEESESEKSSAPSSSRERDNERESEEASTSAEPQPEDRGAQEVEQAPTPQARDADAAFLDDIAASGVDTNGAESQLIGAGNTACNPDDSVTIPAVAGQLIEQGRTDQSAEEVAALISEKAQAAYC